jgi:hypothetical protein
VGGSADDVDCHAISTTSLEIECVLTDADDPGTATIADLRAQIAAADSASFLASLTSGEMWNHLGSFFDRSQSDNALDRRFRHAQIQLAEIIESAGVAATDVSQ